ncbi:MAG: cupin domain-containing protein [Spirulina sp. SIO3F2]|nr:cupin domain-containing protein [Spirulina sp. SIO3F2]
MTPTNRPISAIAVPASTKKTNYPDPFAILVAGREKHKLGDWFGLTNFGVNLTTLAPGAISALCHAHARQDELIYVLEGRPTLIVGEAEYQLEPGQCIGFKAGTGIAHQVMNRTDTIARFLEIGDRTPHDTVEYPQDDLQAVLNDAGQWVFKHKDGTPY